MTTMTTTAQSLPLVTQVTQPIPYEDSSMTQPLESLKKRLISQIKDGLTYGSISRYLGVNRSIIWRIVNTDYEPKKPHIRYKLNLHALIPVAPCPKCGEVHVSKKCIHDPKPKHKYHYVTINGHDYRVTKAVKEYIKQLEETK